MNILRYLSFCTLVLATLPSFPQASLDSLLQMVNNHNISLGVASQYFETVKIGSKRNFYLENPAVGFAYLWGSPGEMGNRTDLTVSQSFAFPTVYTNRSQLSNAEIKKASLLFASLKVEKLLEAKQLWIEKVYLNKKHQVLYRRMADLERVSSLYRMQYENGEISRLRLNKILLLQATLKAELEDLLAASGVNNTKISKITGNYPVDIYDTLYYLADVEVQDSVIKASLRDPLYRSYILEIDRLNIQKRLTRATGMPKIRTGYYSENTSDLSLRGFQLGITIPLWENSNKVKHASGEILTAEMEAEKFRETELARITGLYTLFVTHLKKVDQLSNALALANDPELLSLSLETGEITMIEYFYEAELYYQVMHDLLVAEKDLHLAEAELNKYNLYDAYLSLE
jgi:outer membrane protein TolC